MAHGNDVGVAANRTNRIGDGFTLCSGAALGLGETQDAAAQVKHGGLKAEPCTGRGFKEQCCQFFMTADLLILFRTCNDVLRSSDQLVDFLYGQICDIDEISHNIALLSFVFMSHTVGGILKSGALLAALS